MMTMTMMVMMMMTTTTMMMMLMMMMIIILMIIITTTTTMMIMMIMMMIMILMLMMMITTTTTMMMIMMKMTTTTTNVFPTGEPYYSPDCRQCVGGPNSPTISGCRGQLATTEFCGLPSNPCTRDNILSQRLYFACPLDETQYLQCNNWGHAFVMRCQQNEVSAVAEVVEVVVVVVVCGSGKVKLRGEHPQSAE